MSEEAKGCIWCGSALPKSNAKRCSACKAWQENERCAVCREPIARSAKHCNSCDSPQRWWGRLKVSHTSLALLVALFTTLAPALEKIWDFLNRHSDTSVVVSSSTPEALVFSVVNTGRSASVVYGMTLDFPGLPLGRAPLRVIPEDSLLNKTYIAPGATAIRAQTDGVPVRGALAKDAIAPLLTNERIVTLTICVRESDDPDAGPWTPVEVSIPASTIHEFILNGITDHEEPDQELPVAAAPAAGRKGTGPDPEGLGDPCLARRL